MDFVKANCPHAVEEGPFYESEGHVVDFPREVHRTPRPRALEEGGLGVLHHFIDTILDDYFKQGEGKTDVGTFVPPIKTPKQQSRAANVGRSKLNWDESSTTGLPSDGGWQAFLRSGGNRYELAASVKRHVSNTFIVYGTRGQASCDFVNVKRIFNFIQQHD